MMQSSLRPRPDPQASPRAPAQSRLVGIGTPLGSLAAEDLLEVCVRRDEVASSIVTTNRPPENWGKFLGDVPAGTAILDHCLGAAEIVRMQGKSYRLRNRKWEDEQKEA